MRLAAAYLVTLGIGLSSAVCAIPLSTPSSGHSGSHSLLDAPLEISTHHREFYPIQARFVAPVMASETPHPVINSPRAKELVRIFLNQEHYHGLEPHDIIWQNEYVHDEAGMDTISFLMMDPISDTPCYTSCIGSLKFTVTPASTIHGVLASNSDNWRKLNAELFSA
ncbi:hypothetical protein F5051DRAFT_181373 [Lentinula edodes]|nr:hypothetical protein F5051DRAFT_181373 [Lentinula edodes]